MANPMTNAFLGLLFEPVAHRIMSREQGLTLISLDGRQSEVVATKFSGDSKSFPLENGSALEFDVYYRPLARNFPSVDAFSIHTVDLSGNYVLLLYQMTVSSNHPVKERTINFLEGQVSTQFGRRPLFVHLVFCLCVENSDFRKQPIHDDSKHVVQPTLTNLFQWMCVVPLSHAPSIMDTT